MLMRPTTANTRARLDNHEGLIGIEREINSYNARHANAAPRRERRAASRTEIVAVKKTLAATSPRRRVVVVTGSCTSGEHAVAYDI